MYSLRTKQENFPRRPKFGFRPPSKKLSTVVREVRILRWNRLHKGTERSGSFPKMDTAPMPPPGPPVRKPDTSLNTCAGSARKRPTECSTHWLTSWRTVWTQTAAGLPAGRRSCKAVLTHLSSWWWTEHFSRRRRWCALCPRAGDFPAASPSRRQFSTRQTICRQTF